MVCATDIERFESRYIIHHNGCWIWQGPLDKDGYGSFYFQKFTRRAHRFSFWLVNGTIPDGNVINHICRNRACVNPQHLESILPAENNFRGSLSLSAINARKTTCSLGHPFDKTYTNHQNGRTQRICSICERAKHKRLKAKNRLENSALRKVC